APDHTPGRHNVVQLSLQGNVEPGSGRECWRHHGQRRSALHTHAFHVGRARLELIRVAHFLQLQRAAEEARSAVEVAVALALALVDAGQPHGEVVLPGAGVDGDTGQRL